MLTFRCTQFIHNYNVFRTAIFRLNIFSISSKNILNINEHKRRTVGYTGDKCGLHGWVVIRRSQRPWVVKVVISTDLRDDKSVNTAVFRSLRSVTSWLSGILCGTREEGQGPSTVSEGIGCNRPFSGLFKIIAMFADDCLSIARLRCNWP